MKKIIYLSRIYENICAFTPLLGNKKFFAVVKSNAYGHNIEKVVSFLEKKAKQEKILNQKLLGYCVKDFEEAKKISNLTNRDILILIEPLKYYLKKIKNYKNIYPTVYSLEDLKIAIKHNIPFHIKIDTGMTRLGFYPQEFLGLKRILLKKINLIKGIFSHLSCADTDKNFTIKQYKTFIKLTKDFKRKNKNIILHLENSYGCLYNLKNLDAARIGLFLYFFKRQAMEVYSYLLQTKWARYFQKVSYCGTYKVKNKEYLGVVFIGYNEGIFRRASNKAYFLIKGKKAYIKGSVCMNLIIVSLPSEFIKRGEKVEILSERHNLKYWSKILETIPYEILTSIKGKEIFIE